MMRIFIVLTFLASSMYLSANSDIDDLNKTTNDSNSSLNKFKEMIIKGMEEKLKKLKEVNIEKKK